MPDHPPPQLAEPASPLLLDQGLAQATAEAHTYVRHIERYSALAARAAERVRDVACFCTCMFPAASSIFTGISLALVQRLQPHILARSLCYARTHYARGAYAAESAHTPRSSQQQHRHARCWLLA